MDNKFPFEMLENEGLLNDVYFDVKAECTEYLSNGLSSLDALKGITYNFAEALKDADDSPYVWLAIASSLNENGGLTPEIERNAFKALESLGIHPANTNTKKPRKKHVKCKWKVGDVYWLQIDSKYAHAAGLAGCHLLIRVVDLFKAYGDEYPHCYLSVHKKESAPSTREDVAEAEYIQADRDRTFRFLLTAQDEDEYSRFHYLGSFYDVDPPTNEFICPKELLKLGRVPLPLECFEELACRRYAALSLGKELVL